MNLSKLISNSFKYPFRNIKKLPILCILFLLICIVPLGIIVDNNYIKIFGIIAFLLFILIVPGYLLSIVSVGLNGSSMFPSLDFGSNVYNTIRLLVLRIVYMIVPVLVFFISLSTLGMSSINSLLNLQILNFLATLGLTLLLILLTYIIFEFLLFFAKARLAYLDSLSEALKINKVISDIRNIGFLNIIVWIIVMLVLLNVVSIAASSLMAVPYVGFLIYVCVVIPIMESIANYSLGLMYSNIVENNDDDLDKFEKEIRLLKYSN